MFKNYFKTTFRNLWKHRGFSFINLVGLAVGLSAGFLIFLYVHFEKSYDNFHQKSDRIYRVVCDITTPTEVLHPNVPGWAVPSHLKPAFPEVETFARALPDDMLVRRGNVKFQDDKVIWADSTLFQVFDFKLLKGNATSALKEPLTVVVTETGAKKYFGKEDPMGQTLLITNDGLPATVTGVMKDIPENSTIQGDLFFSMSTITKKFNEHLDDQWGNFGAPTYLLLVPGTNPKTLTAKFPAFFQKNVGDEMKRSKMSYALLLEPLRDVYLRSDRQGSKGGNIANVNIFSIVAIFILVIACINFVNLATARAAERAKEVGIRKVSGAGRWQLSAQFIGESIMMCFIAFLLTLLLSALFLPLFNQLAGKTISPGIFSSFRNPLMLLGAAMAIGVLAGIYPALVLSSFDPIVVLKGRFATGTRGILLRKGLVIAQFTISIVLIVSTIIVYTQMKFMRNQDLGFTKEQILVVDTQGDKARDAFKQAVAAMPNVKATSLTASVPGGNDRGAYSEIENVHGELQVANLDLFFVDYDYLTQYKMTMVAGRGFSRDFGSDTTQAMVLNESAARLLGYATPQQAINRKFKQWGREGKIIGVVKDFHFRSLREVIKPLTMRIEPSAVNLLSATIAPQNISSTLTAIEAKWKTLMPDRPFSYFFMDEFFNKQYVGEEKFGKLFLNFAVLAIMISCLGLLGLASYSTMQRTKEIGIRKVLGASVSGIVNLLSWDFLKLVLISFVIAAPIAWFFMYKWLQDFAYRIPIYWWIFILAGTVAILIALLTISVQAIRAAIANPATSLRTE